MLSALRRARAARLHPDLHQATLRQRFGPDVLVDEVQRPGAGRLSRRRREVGEVERAVAREVRVEHHIVEPLRGGLLHRRHAGDWRRNEAVGLHDAHGPGALQDQEIAVGQERHRPGARQPGRDRLDVERRRGPGRGGRIGLARKCRRRLWRLRDQRRGHGRGQQREEQGGRRSRRFHQRILQGCTSFQHGGRRHARR